MLKLQYRMKTSRTIRKSNHLAIVPRPQAGKGRFPAKSAQVVFRRSSFFTWARVAALWTSRSVIWCLDSLKRLRCDSKSSFDRSSTDSSAREIERLLAFRSLPLEHKWKSLVQLVPFAFQLVFCVIPTPFKVRGQGIRRQMHSAVVVTDA